MADDEAWQYWRSVMGDSDDDGEDDFEGFTLREIVKGDESDIDLDIVVQNQELIRQFSPEISSSSDVNRSGSGGEELLEANDAELPVVAGPSKAKRRKRQSKTKRDALTTRWSAQTSRVQPEKAFQGFAEDGNIKVGVDHTLPVDATPYDYFCLLLPETFWTDVAHQTNVYAEQRQQNKGTDKTWKETTAVEMKLFIFIQFMFGIHRMPETAMYWSSDPLLRVSAIADVMSKGRFQKLSQYFHLNDNSAAVPKGQPEYDALFKVRPLLDAITVNSRAHYFPGRDISIDEAMIKFNGRLSFKQYIKGKPNPWGIKVWCAADPRSGYMLEFDIYLGRVLAPMPHGLGHHVIMKMADRFLERGHHLFFDNYFSSVKLGQDLEEKGTYMCSTIRMNRSGWPKELNAQCAKKMKAGDIHFRQDGNMVATLWKDKRPVAILSTNAQPEMGEAERKAPGGKKKVAVPKPVLAYNTSMGGVDLADQHHSYYPVGRPSVRWWRYICWWLLQTAMVNSFIIWSQSHQPAPTRKGKRHVDFRLDVLRQLCKGNSVRRRDGPEAVSQAGVTTAQPLSHTIERFPGSKKNCSVCEKAKKRTDKGYGVKTVWGCLVCKVHLCKGHCFAQFHQQLAQSVS